MVIWKDNKISIEILPPGNLMLTCEQGLSGVYTDKETGMGIRKDRKFSIEIAQSSNLTHLCVQVLKVKVVSSTLKLMFQVNHPFNFENWVTVKLAIIPRVSLV